jgi:hypothetical protein
MIQKKKLNEGLYDNFDPRKCEIIYYNHYQEDWGEEGDEDITDLYNILIYDINGNIAYDEDGLLLTELDDLLGDDISYMIWHNEGEENTDPQLKRRYPYVLRNLEENNFKNIDEAVEFFFGESLCQYYPNMHGYIMQDGTCIALGEYTDHNEICKIPQINNKWEFVALGNIRCSNSSFDLIQKPTMEQKRALRKLIANSTDLTVDIFSSNKDTPLTSAIYYGESDPDFVLGQIDRFFNEGIKLRGNYL